MIERPHRTKIPFTMTLSKENIALLKKRPDGLVPSRYVDQLLTRHFKRKNKKGVIGASSQ